MKHYKGLHAQSCARHPPPPSRGSLTSSSVSRIRGWDCSFPPPQSVGQSIAVWGLSCPASSMGWLEAGKDSPSSCRDWHTTGVGVPWRRAATGKWASGQWRRGEKRRVAPVVPCSRFDTALCSASCPSLEQPDVKIQDSRQYIRTGSRDLCGL